MTKLLVVCFVSIVVVCFIERIVLADGNSQSVFVQKSAISNFKTQEVIYMPVLSNRNDFLIAFFSGSASVILGFLLEKAYEYYRNKRDILSTDIKIMHVMKGELITNLKIIEKNLNMVTLELSVLDQNQTTVEPLEKLHDSSWNLFQLNIPQNILKNPELLSKVKDLYDDIANLNQLIESRESYRLTNQAYDNYSRRVGIYDAGVKQKLESINIVISTLKELLKV